MVGGGIGGLAAARALQLAGWTVQVLEQAARLEPLGAGISLWPNAVHALNLLDVPLAVRSSPAGPGGLRASHGRWLSRTDSATYPARYGAQLLAVHRAELQHALLASLPPDTVATGARVTGLEPRPDGVLVRHDRGVHRAELAVLADGLASPTRRLVTGRRPRPRYAGYTAWCGITSTGAAFPPLSGATETWGRGERFGLVPLADGRTYWFATANTKEGQQATAGEHTEVRRRFSAWHDPIAEVLVATDPTGVLRHDVYDLRPHPSRYTSGRLVLLGDAAHAMTPNLGQGACQALEDAATLRVLAGRSTDLGTVLAGYDALRRPRARGVALRSRQLGRLGQLSGHGTTCVRDLLMRAAPGRTTNRQLDSTLSWSIPSS